VNNLPSVLWHCWLGGRKGIRPVKNWAVVICLVQGADLHMAQRIPLSLTVSCFSKIQIGFTFLVPAHPGSPGQRAIKRVCVCVYWWTSVYVILHRRIWKTCASTCRRQLVVIFAVQPAVTWLLHECNWCNMDHTVLLFQVLWAGILCQWLCTEHHCVPQ